MKKGLLIRILILLLLAIAVFTVFRYVSYLKGQAVILEKEKQNLLQGLEKERQIQAKLSQENLGLKGNLRAGRKRLMELFKDVREAQKVTERLNSELALLKAENTDLRQQEDEFKLKFSQVAKENEVLKAKLGSIAELKNAIKELRMKMRQASTQIRQETETGMIIEGNHGYLVKNGQTTYPTKVKIEVIPIPKE